MDLIPNITLRITAILLRTLLWTPCQVCTYHQDNDSPLSSRRHLFELRAVSLSPIAVRLGLPVLHLTVAFVINTIFLRRFTKSAANTTGTISISK